MSVYKAENFRGRKRSSQGGCNAALLLLLVLGVAAVYIYRWDIVKALQEGLLRLTSDTLEERLEHVSVDVSARLQAELESKGLQWGAPIFVRIFKETNELEVWMETGERFVLFKVYSICARSGGLGPKLKDRDRQGPEGFYFVSAKRLNPDSRYHLEIDLGYPNDYDRHHNRQGSGVRIQGACRSNGSYALDNDSMDEVYALSDAAISAGQQFFRVHIFPFRMTDERMDEVLQEKSKWLDFWSNLKEGYDYFEIVGAPPNTTVSQGKYRFE